ncbi:hypothetical protein WICPIJ_003873 [Wickerhamomyces pijperi]|uniref:Uncharacterized protein n=1 Tax=Wickerhamomyces pijperi TaxID=599730 RepID=A0A9P8TNB7_WICPI|nr:hypothetical protein WICPIJ_003873 [Wickerhamomyces pijperi]
MEVWAEEDKVLLALSAAVLNLLKDLWLVVKSFLFFLLNSAAKWSTNLLSKSSPPKWVSPAVDLTSKIPSSMANRETSKVPPPKSKIKTFFSPSSFLSKPLSLGIVEVGWDGDDGVVDLFTKEVFSGFLHLDQDHGGDFFRSEHLGFTLELNLDLWLGGLVDNLEWEVLDVTLHLNVVKLSTNQTLSIENSVGWVHGGLVLGSITNQSFRVGEGNERRSGSVTLVIGDNFNTVVGEVSNTGIGST